MRVRVSDGIQLKVDIYQPTDLTTGQAARGSFPILLTQDPYGGGVLTTALDAPAPGSYFAQHGYIFVHMNTRGAGGTGGVGGSEGTPNLFDARTSLDGLEMAYWAADPHNVPGSNGKVGLQGCSFLGISQVSSLNQLGLLLKEHGSITVPGATPMTSGHVVPVTKASNPIVTSIPACNNGDFYRDTFFDGGIPHPTWALFPAGPAIDGVITSDIFANLTDYTLPAELFSGGDIGFDRQYWRERNWLLDADSLARTLVPMLMWVGWNEPGTIGAQELYAAMQNASTGRPSHLPMTPTQRIDPKYQLIIGDWGHGGGLDFGIELEWFDTWMRGVKTGINTASTPVHMKEMPSSATPRWINTRTFPHTATYTPYYLGTGEALTSSKPTTAGSDTLAWAPGVSTSYTLAQPMVQDMTLIGPSALRIWVSSTNANLQLFNQLLDVAPDGTSTEITHGSVLGSRKLLDPKLSWSATNGLPTQPHLVLDADRPITAGTVQQYDVPLQPPAWRIVKGHSLQLRIASQVDPSQCANPTTLIGKPAGCLLTKPMLQTLPGGVYTVLHDPAHPSFVNVPLVPSSTLTTARAGVTPTSNGVVLPQDWGPNASTTRTASTTRAGIHPSGHATATTPSGSLPTTGLASGLAMLGMALVLMAATATSRGRSARLAPARR